jgi:glycosyltransferase involved in cell wall biosynthesis
MKVLLIAYSCQPNTGSEPGVGWNFVMQAAKRHDITVITDERPQQLKDEIYRAAPPNVSFHFLGWFWLHPLIRRMPLRLGWLYFYIWQFTAYRYAKKLHKVHHFDLVHQVTFATWRLPNFLWKLGIPFIWGPIGGGEESPRCLLKPPIPLSTRVGESFRRFAQRLFRYDPLIAETARNATLITTGNRDTANLIFRSFGRKSIRLAPSGIEAVSSANLERQRSDEVRLISAGVFDPRKAFDLAIRALHRCKTTVPLRLTIYGEGKARQRLERIVRDLGLTDSVSLPGWAPREKLLQHIANSDIFVFSSLRDQAPTVVLEAMAAGKPVICLDCGGPGELVTDECGIKIIPHSPGQVIRDFATAIERLAKDPELRRRMGEAGRKRVAELYTWDVKGERILQIYEQAIDTFKRGGKI